MGLAMRVIAALGAGPRWVAARPRPRWVPPGLATGTVLLTVASVLVAVGAVSGSPAQAGQRPAAQRGPLQPCAPDWVTAWQTSPQAAADASTASTVAGRTLRMIVHPQVTGSEIRVRLSNRYGAVPLLVGAVSAAHASVGAAVVDGTVRPVSFGGLPVVAVPPGAELLSDPIPFVAQAGQPIAVSMFLPAAPDRVATHPVALQTSYVSEAGDFADAVDGTAFRTPIRSWLVLSGVDVLVPRPVNAVVLVGDSITDGVGSDPDRDDRWSDALSGRLAPTGGGATMSVLNAGISRNQLLSDRPDLGGDSPGTRFVHDVAAVAGVTDVVLHIGTNDIAAGRGAGEIIPGLVRFADQARAAGLRVFLTTITPSGTGAHGTPQAVAVRDAVNGWVRTQGPAHADGVFDFAAAVAEPAHPARLRPDYDSGDGLHLSALGYRALAGAVQADRLTGSPCLDEAKEARVAVSGARRPPPDGGPGGDTSEQPATGSFRRVPGGSDRERPVGRGKAVIGMEIAREIEVFLAVAEELHFGRAAARLHLTPSRVSQAIRALERRIGAPLFERTSRSVRLTPLGRTLFEEVRPAFQRLEEALRRAKRAAGREPQGVLKVCFANSLREEVTAALVHGFTEVYPRVPLVRYAYPSVQHRQWCDQERDDVFVSWFPDEPDSLDLPRVEVGPVIMREPRSVMVGVDHPLAGHDVVDIEELADHDVLYPPPVTQRFADAWTPPVTPAGRAIRRVQRMTDSYMEEAVTIVVHEHIAHVTITRLPPALLRPDLVLVPLTGLPPFWLASLWSVSAQNIWIREFAELAAHTGLHAG
ncbi:GDSL-type esterase/lipase family protein [Pseudonocardia bannensis]|uniref:LysR family transcriptional regulator n=1 Tax=Pseudonocardia bannensis TaxID=630973 RepID=A0A848DH09_9PSEU|nr:GDSL-type esterase/lipase family protein [Pseudonocardia bannensis]NMH91960.1 LysR family transcriptional regulator [Pseudonocardia bannensis]